MTFIPCTIKGLPAEKVVASAEAAVEVNPANAPNITGLSADDLPSREHLAVMTNKRWSAGGVRLTVGFLDSPPADLQRRILAHMNAWGAWANVRFVASAVDPQVRIARVADDGYWSYLGTDILLAAANEQTMNLEGFTMNTPESEFHRVVRHETGHTLGFPHEHRRKAIVEPVFGLLKRARGFRQFLLRGLAKVQGEWALICTGHNLLKLYRSGRWARA